MIDPRTQWIIHKDKERELLFEIEWQQKFAPEKHPSLAQSWYTQAAAWLSQVVLHIQPGKRSIENITLDCCPTCGGSCPSN